MFPYENIFKDLQKREFHLDLRPVAVTLFLDTGSDDVNLFLRCYIGIFSFILVLNIYIPIIIHYYLHIFFTCSLILCQVDNLLMKTFWSPDYLLMLSFSLSVFFNSLYILHLFLLFLSYFLTILFFCLLLSLHSPYKNTLNTHSGSTEKVKGLLTVLATLSCCFPSRRMGLGKVCSMLPLLCVYLAGMCALWSMGTSHLITVFGIVKSL